MSTTDRVPPLLIDGPETAAATLLLAHGAGAPMDSPFLEAIAGGLATQGWRVVRFEFPYMQRMRLSGRRQAPDRLPRLQEAFCEHVQLQRQQRPDQPLILAGKSLGGRVASLIVDELAAAGGIAGCLCFGFPFHPAGKPEQLRTQHLQTLRTPTLILQGERDSFGRRAEVEEYPLAAAVELHWIPCGDHSFKPPRRSGLSEPENWAAAVSAGDRFLRRLLEPRA